MGEPGLPRECQQDALWSYPLQCMESYMQALDSQVREPANSIGLLSLELVGGPASLVKPVVQTQVQPQSGLSPRPGKVQ